MTPRKISLKANSPSDLLRDLRKIDIFVPGLRDGRTSAHRENWSACRLLSSLAENKILKFPLEIRPQERPDFVLQIADREIGIEITEATHPGFVETLAGEANFPDPWIELPPIRPDSNRKCWQKMHSEDGVLPQIFDSHWIGDEVERIWSAYIGNAIGKKTTSLQSASFSKFQENWLLIYDNTPTPALVINNAVQILEAHLHSYWNTSPRFSHVFVEMKTNVLLDITHAFIQILPLVDVWHPG